MKFEDQLIQLNLNNGMEFMVLDGDICHQPEGWNFWSEQFMGDWERWTFDIMDQFLDKEHDYLDIGAWVGPTVIYGSKLSRLVNAVEPDEAALFYLRENIKRNCNNVRLYEKAVALTTSVDLYTHNFPGDSMSSIQPKGTLAGTVDGVTLETLMYAGDYSLMKMDIEGGEAVVLPPNKQLLGDLKIPFALSTHYGFYQSDADHAAVMDAISVYNKFTVDGVETRHQDIPRGFHVVLCQ